jgi:uncharacterized NAD(P)/FAD-binding protein YdhS
MSVSRVNGGASANGNGFNADPPVRIRRAPAGVRIAIVGGGAAGTISAVHLMRRVEEGSVDLTMFDADGEFGPGVAYGTSDPLHVLNVPACRMGGISGHPEHFHDWVRARGEEAGPQEFLPRGLFGTYLRSLLNETATACSQRARLERRAGEVVSLSVPHSPLQPLSLGLADGSRVEAEQAVLALGPLRGGDPIAVPEELRADGSYVSEPWAPGALDPVRDDESVLVIGTGLTMVDLALSLSASDRGPTIRAISRHGLVPRRHRREMTEIKRFPVPLEDGRLEPVVTAVFEQICRVSQQGGDWRDVFDSMRSSTPAIWRSLRVEEKRRFLDGLQRLWDVHRFRMAPVVADRFEELEAAGRISVDARQVVALEPRRGRVRVSLHAVGEAEPEIIDVDRVINCTGAGANLARQAPPLVRDLLGSGTARPDPLGIGLDVAENGGLIDAAGRVSERLRVVGSLRKGVEWEAIGVTEIRDHAEAVAAELFATVERPLQVAS